MENWQQDSKQEKFKICWRLGSNQGHSDFLRISSPLDCTNNTVELNNTNFKIESEKKILLKFPFIIPKPQLRTHNNLPAHKKRKQSSLSEKLKKMKNNFFHLTHNTKVIFFS